MTAGQFDRLLEGQVRFGLRPLGGVNYLGRRIDSSELLPDPISSVALLLLRTP